MRAFVEQRKGVGNRGLRVEEAAVVAEGIRRDVDHAHDERAAAQLQRAAAEAPRGEAASEGVSH